MHKSIKTLLLVVTASISATLYATDFVTRTYPLGIDIEGQYFQSSIFLRLQVKDYNMPFAEFAKGEHDAYESTFISFITALRENDAARTAKLLQPERRAATAAAPKPEHSPADVLRAYRAAFDAMKDIVVVAQILDGSKHLFIWDAGSGADAARRAFAVESDGDALAVREVTSHDPVAVIILANVMTAMRQNPAAYQSPAARSTKFEYALPAGGDSVVMQFGGNVVDIAPARLTAAAVSATGSSSDVLRAYAETAEALRVHATDQFLAHFTPRSAKRVKKLIDGVPEGAYDSLYELAWQARHIRLIVGSDPVYIVFYTLGDRSDYHYDYLVRDGATNKLLFANIGRQSFADDVLGRRELFDPARVVAQPGPATR